MYVLNLNLELDFALVQYKVIEGQSGHNGATSVKLNNDADGTRANAQDKVC